jgi:hypothetical protein
MLWHLSCELLGLHVKDVTVETVNGPNRGHYAQAVLLFHRLLPGRRKHNLFQEYIGLHVVANRTPQDTSELMNMSHTVVSRGETNKKIATCGDQHLRNVAITLLANAFRFILWCWDNFRRSWRQSQWGAVCIAGPTGIAHTDLIDFAVKVAEIEHHYPAGIDPTGRPPVAEPPQNFGSTYVDPSVDSAYRDTLFESLLGPRGLNYNEASEGVAPSLMDAFFASGAATFQEYVEKLADAFFDAHQDQTRCSGTALSHCSLSFRVFTFPSLLQVIRGISAFNQSVRFL